MYFSGQGKIFVAPIIDGLVGVFRWVGNVPDFSPKFDTSKLEHKESWSGQRLLDKSITTENKSTISATLEDWSPENLALAVRGTVGKTPTAAVTGELSPADLAAGDIWALKGVKVSSVTITDSANGSPATVTNTKYTVDPDFGTIVFKEGGLTGYTLPLKAAYTPAAADVVAFFTEGVKEVAVRFEGVNTADGNKKVLAEIYKVALDPTAELGLITEELGQFVLEGSALADQDRPDDVLFGKFGRLVYL